MMAFKLLIGMETICFSITNLFFRKIFFCNLVVQFQFDIRTKVQLKFMVGLTTPSLWCKRTCQIELPIRYNYMKMYR